MNNQNNKETRGKLYRLTIGAGKVLIAGAVAFFILNLFAHFYYNIPGRAVSYQNSTDFARTENDPYFKMVEGFGYGKTDAKGFNNVRVIENPDILIIGSSQLEGYNVKTEENITAILNDMFSKDGSNLEAYNIGVSGHNFGVCLNNLGEAYEEFNPKKYVVIETRDVLLEPEQMDKLQNGTYPRDDAIPRGVAAFLQKSDYLRLVYLKLSEMRVQKAKPTVAAPVPAEEWDEEYISTLNAILSNAKEEVGDCRLIIISSGSIMLDGENVQERANEHKYEILKKVCLENDIVFLDTYEDFKKLYEEKKVLPSGFSNTHLGKGHLNAHGHQVLAEKLYGAITEMEGAR